MQNDRSRFQANTVGFTLVVTAITFWWSASSANSAGKAPFVLPLPNVKQWSYQSTVAQEIEGKIELELTVNYQNGRVASPPTPAKPGELFTLAADVATMFPPNQASYYRFWLSLEFLQDERLVGLASSGEIVGVQEKETLVAVTGIAPEKTTHVRAVLQAQNKFWSVVKNRATVTDLRLLKLSGGRGGWLDVQVAKRLPKTAAERTATLEVQGDWPDGAAVVTRATRGRTPQAALMSGGRAEIALHFSDKDVGSASVTATIDDQAATAVVADPYAGSLKVAAITADGKPTPALIRLSRQGELLPGRYQASVPGNFVTPPYTVELAPGTWRLEVCRGPQFETYARELGIAGGETEQVDQVETRRLVDLRTAGWYGGDADGDVYHGERIYTDVSVRTAADIAQAMGLDWVGVGSWGIKPKNWAEARAHIRSLSAPELLFMWTDEQPKTRQGHACFLGLVGPDAERLSWAWTGPKRPLENFEILQTIRAHGGATFVNHPLRWWMKGDRFNTNMYSSLAFDLCAAGALDGFNINDGPRGIEAWSMLLDHGYRVAATAGADFGLDRPAGPVPGKARMYCYCPRGVSERTLADAVRSGHTIVSTGPVLLADIAGKPPGSMVSANTKHKIRVKAWARGDQFDPLKRIELWAHGKVLVQRNLNGGNKAAEEPEWQTSGELDWVAVRVVSQHGWAVTSAFYADGEQWRARRPLDCQLTLDVQGLGSDELAKGQVEIWNRAPSLPGAMRLETKLLRKVSRFMAPVTAALVIRVPGRPVQERNVFDGLGVREIIDKIAAGESREQPLLDWDVYQQVLTRCQTGRLEIRF